MQVDQRKILYKIEDQENQNIRQNQRICSPPEERGEDLRKIMNIIFNPVLNKGVEDSLNIERFHELRKPKNITDDRPKDIIVRSQLYEDKAEIYSKDFPNWYYGDSTTKRAKGVAIGFAKGTRFTLEDRMTDTEGRYLFRKGRLGEMTCTLANIYCPNRNPIKYLKENMGKLIDFKKGYVILTGDLNFCMDPRLDTMSHLQGMKNVLLKMIKQKIHQCQMMDVWRIQHPKIQNYTFYFPVHGTYSRLDYIMVDHRLLGRVIETNIEISMLSDHSPVTIK